MRGGSLENWNDRDHREVLIPKCNQPFWELFQQSMEHWSTALKFNAMEIDGRDIEVQIKELPTKILNTWRAFTNLKFILEFATFKHALEMSQFENVVQHVGRIKRLAKMSSMILDDVEILPEIDDINKFPQAVQIKELIPEHDFVEIFPALVPVRAILGYHPVVEAIEWWQYQSDILVAALLS